MTKACPNEEDLARWAEGSIPADDIEGLATHVAGCGACARAYACAVALQGGDAPRIQNTRIGAVLADKYEVVEHLGSGGMGVVVRARHLRLQRDVALKLIRPKSAHDDDLRTRFAREARVAATLRSPHINRVIDLGELADGSLFMVMELLEGETLQARVQREGPLAPLEVRRLMRQALLGLEAAHDLGVIHRDLKPANLFLQKNPTGPETLVILDFGVAKSFNTELEVGLAQTVQRTLVGSPAFMSPEQLQGHAGIDARTDIWGLGCTMFTLLTGRYPFEAGDFIALAHQIREGAPRRLPLRIDSGLASCVRRCLEKDPARRYQSAREASRALETRSWSRARQRLALGAAVSALTLCMGSLTPEEPALEPEALPETVTPVRLRPQWVRTQQRRQRSPVIDAGTLMDDEGFDTRY